MNSVIKQNILRVYREGMPVPVIAEKLGYEVGTIEKLVRPKSVTTITTAFTTVNIGGRRLIPKQRRIITGKIEEVKVVKIPQPDPEIKALRLISDAMEKIQQALLLLKK